MMQIYTRNLHAGRCKLDERSSGRWWITDFLVPARAALMHQGQSADSYRFIGGKVFVETEKSAAEHRALIKNSRLHPDNELPHDFLILWKKWRPPARTRSKRYSEYSVSRDAYPIIIEKLSTIWIDNSCLITKR